MRAAILIVLGALCGCDAAIQTTSGSEYTRLPVPARSQDALTADVMEAAAVEPLLRFPARIGLARIANGRLTAIPSTEASLWLDMTQAHPNLGEVVPVSPFLAAQSSRPARMVVQNIRLAAAKQHLDAVLVYELGIRSRKFTTGLAFADLSILGAAFLPTRRIDTQGVAQAILVDVRNGYPYLTASTDVDLSHLTPAFGSDARRAKQETVAALAVLKKLVPQIDAATHKLIRKLPRK